MSETKEDRRNRGLRIGECAVRRMEFPAPNPYHEWQATWLKNGKHFRRELIGDAWEARLGDRSVAAREFWHAAILLHIGIDFPFEMDSQCLKKLIPISEDYFFGDWRKNHSQFGYDRLDQQGCRENLTWYDCYRSSLAIALLLGDESMIRRYSEYPDVDCCLEDADIYSKEDLLEKIVLARWLSGRTKGDENAMRNQIEGSRRRKPKLLLSCLSAIQQQDDALFAKTIVDVMKHFLKSDEVNLIDCVSVDATILWNLAMKYQLKLPSLTQDQFDPILTPESIGVTDNEN